MRITKEINKLSKNDASTLAVGTHLQSVCYVTYDQLVEAFGEPSIVSNRENDKVHYTWVLHVRPKGTFKASVVTIYDWKTYDAEYSRNELTKWNIGGHRGMGTQEAINVVVDFLYLNFS